MLALEITSTKQFMNQLLAADAFDSFLLEEAVISTANIFTIDGHVNQDFAASELDFRPWGELRGLCFDLIKGKRTPLFFRFALHLMPEKTAALLESRGCEVEPSRVRALVLNIRYDGTRTVLTTATSFYTFVPSKEPDRIWDKALCQFLEQKGIGYEQL